MMMFVEIYVTRRLVRSWWISIIKKFNYRSFLGNLHDITSVQRIPWFIYKVWRLFVYIHFLNKIFFYLIIYQQYNVNIKWFESINQNELRILKIPRKWPWIKVEIVYCNKSWTNVKITRTGVWKIKVTSDEF